mgnify:CR=1 FL=1
MSVYLKLETGAGGTPLEALTKAVRVAGVLDIMVLLDVNGVEMLVAPKDDPGFLNEQFLKALKRKSKFASALTI